ncbi:MAG: Hsp20/alpha crystallin family protein [Casimicrobiaceae bacterium]
MANPNDPAGWTWTQACDLIDEAERLHRQFFHGGSPARPLAAWQPPVDVFEDEREILVIVAMPGVLSSGLQVVHEPGALVVRGVRPMPLARSRHRVRQLEIPYGMFERRIALPPGRFAAEAPEMMHGCLLLTLRKIGSQP